MSNFEMQFDFDGIITLLAKNLYSEKRVFFRELIQNAHDAILRRQNVEKEGFAGRVDITVDENAMLLVIRDNGMGMNDHDLKNYLSCIGKSGTREAGQEVEGVIGQFGIGFLSAFVVADRVEVVTRRRGETQGWRWINTGRKSYTLEKVQGEVAEGATVTVHLRDVTDRGLLDPEAVKGMILLYGNMLAVPIHLNGSKSPINDQVMPWEKHWLNPGEMERECRAFLARTQAAEVIEVFPMPLRPENGVEGLLFITRQRESAPADRRAVKLYQNRMFITDQADGLLPSWATFCHGVINANRLTPTAARDTFIRNAAVSELQELLEERLIAFLLELNQRDGRRFKEFLRHHNLALKNACDHHPPFFQEFVDLLLWRVNDGAGEGKETWLTLPEIRAQQPGREALACFTDRAAASHHFRMARDAGVLVVDASHAAEESLLKKYAKAGHGVRLLWLDREEDGRLLRPVGAEEEAFAVLAAEMGKRLPSGHGLEVSVRRFAPSTQPAVLVAGEEARQRAVGERVQADGNLPPELRAMAGELTRPRRQAKHRLHLNADNPLVQRLAQLLKERPREVALNQVMGGILHGAALLNDAFLTPERTRALHDQFHTLLEEHMERAYHGLGHFLTVFLMIPYEDHGEIEEEIRQVVEEDWGCRFLVAKERHFAPDIRANVIKHITEADAFIAEVTTMNTNVMIELGLVLGVKPDAPLFLLYDGAKRSKLPADLEGYIPCNYALAQGQELTRRQYIRQDLERNVSWHTMLTKPRMHLVSAQVIAKRTRLGQKNMALCQELAQRFPSRESWRQVQEDDLAALGVHDTAAGPIITAMTKP